MMGTIPSVALAASINSLWFADIIKEVINIDIGGVPFFGSLQILNIGLFISRGNMTTKLLNTALPSDSPLKRYTNNLPDGLSVFYEKNSLEDTTLTMSYTLPPSKEMSHLAPC